MSELQQDSFNCIAYIGGTAGLHLNLDRFRCFLAYFSIRLNQINFGYICISLLLIIMLISIFGGIKENYKWFIFNQAFWDLAISYRYICNNLAQYIFYGIFNSPCFYNFETGYLKDFFEYGILTNSYSALLLLSFTRVISIYFPQVYYKLTRTRRIFYLIFVFNLFVTFTNINTLFNTLLKQRNVYLKGQCLHQTELKNISQEICTENYDYDFLASFYKILFNIFSGIIFIKPLIFLFISFISTIFIMKQVFKQLKLRLKNNKKDLMNSVRICIVILLQTLINSFVFLLECAKNIPLFIGNTFNVRVMTSQNSYICPDCIYFILPQWLYGQYGLAYLPVLQAIVQCRIFIESFLLLFIMTGYREALFSFIITPFKFLLKKKAEISSTKVFVFKK